MQGVKWYVEHNEQAAVVMMEAGDGYSLRCAISNKELFAARNLWPVIEAMTSQWKRNEARKLRHLYSVKH